MKKIIPLILLFIISCKAKQDVVDVSKNNTNSTEYVAISIDQNENMQFTIKNISDEDIFIFESKRLNIEKYENDSWRALRILPCPCDAPCHPGKEKELLTSGQSIILTWNMKESWCGNKKQGMVRETIKEPVGKGKYRIKIDYAGTNNNRKSYYKEFSIE